MINQNAYDVKFARGSIGYFLSGIDLIFRGNCKASFTIPSFFFLFYLFPHLRFSLAGSRNLNDKQLFQPQVDALLQAEDALQGRFVQNNLLKKIISYHILISAII